MTLAEVLKQGLTVIHNDIHTKISIKNVALVYKGIRPAKMDKALFKSVRRELNKLLNEHKKGEIFHLSRMTNYLWESLGGKKSKQKSSTFKGKVNDRKKKRSNTGTK